MGSEYERDRDKGTLEISQTQFIQSVLNRFGVSKSSLIPATPSLDLRNVSEETVVGVPFREIVGSLMWVANQTRPDICLLYTSPSPRDGLLSRMPSSA